MRVGFVFCFVFFAKTFSTRFFLFGRSLSVNFSGNLEKKPPAGGGPGIEVAVPSFKWFYTKRKKGGGGGIDFNPPGTDADALRVGRRGHAGSPALQKKRQRQVRRIAWISPLWVVIHHSTRDMAKMRQQRSRWTGTRSLGSTHRWIVHVVAGCPKIPRRATPG